jgi:hemoglobin-like flavoprotein
MSLNVPLLRSSFELVTTRQPDLTHLFYDELFTRYPQAKPLFNENNRAKQEKMLTDALVAVLDHLEDAPWLVNTLAGLGQKHVGYGVTAEMYSWVGESLLATIAKVAASDWSKELEEAWTAAYGAIVSMMLPKSN